jgi:hypothetical protein
MGRWWARALVLGLTAGCSGSSIAFEVDRLEGRWEWREATGGIAGRTITPASEGYTMELRFLDGDDVELHRSGQPQTNATYRLATGSDEGSFAGKDVVRFTPALFGWDEMLIQLSVEGELILTDGCCDGYTYTFVRAGPAR